MLLGVIAAPDGAEQRAMREDFAGVAYEVREQIEFFWRKSQLSTAVRSNVRIEIDPEFSCLQDASLRIRGRLATERCANARQQLVYAKRFRHVIIGAGIERFDFRLLFA